MVIVKNLPPSARVAGLIPGLGRSPGGGNGIPLQYSCQENPMDRGAGGLQSMESRRVRHDSHLSSSSNLPIALWWGYYFHFRDEKTEASRAKTTCCRSQNWWVANERVPAAPTSILFITPSVSVRKLLVVSNATKKRLKQQARLLSHVTGSLE